MTFAVRGTQQSYLRDALLGIELLDGVTLQRVSAGVTVKAEGLQRIPFPNASGVFVWLSEDLTPLRGITIDPGVLPYDRVELDAAQVQLPITTVQLPPRVDYPFGAGITGLRGVLIEERVAQPVPVRDAEVHLRWLDDSSIWRDAPPVSRTSERGGDFAAVLRLAPGDIPLLDLNGAVTVRLRARRGANERESADLKLPQGRIADPSNYAQGPDALIFAWDELQP
ncbi:MAG TPA: hypothetical protein VM733_09850 [Thermoanaerobaculia bacterium]|nr:hypothetical protein [Thermoanaerobaculia bacterium]